MFLSFINLVILTVVENTKHDFSISFLFTEKWAYSGGDTGNNLRPFKLRRKPNMVWDTILWPAAPRLGPQLSPAPLTTPQLPQLEDPGGTERLLLRELTSPLIRRDGQSHLFSPASQTHLCPWNHRQTVLDCVYEFCTLHLKMLS